MSDPIDLIAEIGLAHGGDFDVAKMMAYEAVKHGATHVKFQLHTPDEMTDDHPWRHDVLSRNLDVNDLVELKAVVEALGAEFLCTPFSLDAAEALRDMGCRSVKIGSGENVYTDLRDFCLEHFHTVYISLGMGGRHSSSPRAINMHCVSRYPTKTSEMDAQGMYGLRVWAERNDRRWGLSSHCPDEAAGLWALSHGATALEFHVTVNGKDPDGRVALFFERFGRISHYARRLNSLHNSTRGNESEVAKLTRRDADGRRVAL